MGSENYQNIIEGAVQDQARLTNAEIKLYPTFSVKASSGRSENKTTDLDNDSVETEYFNPKNVGVDIKQAFEFGKDYYSWEAAQINQKSSLISRRDQKRNLLIGGLSLHLQGAMIQKRMRFLLQRQSYVKKNLKVVLDRMKNGMSSETERDRMLDRIDQVDLERFDLEGQIKNLRLRYHTETGKKIKKFSSINTKKLQKWMPKSKKQFLRMAKKADISILRSKYAYESAVKNSDSAYAALFPKLELLISTNTDDEVNVDKRKKVDKVTVTLTHDLFASGKKAVDYETARSRERTAKMSLQQAKRNLGATLENVWFRFASAQKSMTVSRKKLIRLKRIFKRQQEEFKAARITISDLLDAEEELSRAGEDLLNKELAVSTMMLQVLNLSGNFEKALGINLNGDKA